eukprot:364502-Chlamydomonas_euryale.AAC.15
MARDGSVGRASGTIRAGTTRLTTACPEPARRSLPGPCAVACPRRGAAAAAAARIEIANRAAHRRAWIAAQVSSAGARLEAAGSAAGCCGCGLLFGEAMAPFAVATGTAAAAPDPAKVSD